MGKLFLRTTAEKWANPRDSSSRSTTLPLSDSGPVPLSSAGRVPSGGGRGPRDGSDRPGRRTTVDFGPNPLSLPTPVPPEPQPAGRAIFEVALEGSGLVLRVECNGKAVRKALKAIAEHGPDGVNLLLQGTIKPPAQPGDPLRLEDAGLSAMPKAPEAGRALGGPMIPPADGRTGPPPAPGPPARRDPGAAVPRASGQRAVPTGDGADGADRRLPGRPDAGAHPLPARHVLEGIYPTRYCGRGDRALLRGG